jgi:hypothetical protein
LHEEAARGSAKPSLMVCMVCIARVYYKLERGGGQCKLARMRVQRPCSAPYDADSPGQVVGYCKLDSPVQGLKVQRRAAHRRGVLRHRRGVLRHRRGVWPAHYGKAGSLGG